MPLSGKLSAGSFIAACPSSESLSISIAGNCQRKKPEEGAFWISSVGGWPLGNGHRDL